MKIEYLSFDSALELKEYLKNKKKYNVVLLGEDSIVINSSTAIVIEKNKLIIGLLTDGTKTPECQIREETIFVGFNNEVDCIREGKIVNKIKFDSVFYEFIDVPDYRNLILSLFELGVACFDEYGVLRWKRYTTEIVNDLVVQNNKVLVNTEDGEILLDIITNEMC
ncbi:MAG: hypothetical protein IIY49_09835 [Eubacterium sp.]|nr:hypothetical protein [Eubacterium sp.]